MNHRFKTGRIFLLALLLVLSLSAAAEAAGLPNVSNFRVKTTSTRIRLDWDAVSGAEGYWVYIRSSSGAVLAKKDTKKTMCFVEGLENGKTYDLYVRAHRGTKVYSSRSNIIKYTLNVPKPGIPLLTQKSSTNGTITLTWTSVSGASGYEVSEKITSGYAVVGRYTGTKLTLSKKVGSTKRYVVRAYKTVYGSTIYGDYSGVVTATPGKASTAVSISTSEVRTLYWLGYVSVAGSYPRSDGSGSESVAAWTNVTITDYKLHNGQICTVTLPNGKSVKIPRENLNPTSAEPITGGDYSTAVKEAWVNYTKRYSSKTDYLIWVSLRYQRFYLFKGSKGNWRLQNTWPCVSGGLYNRTAPSSNYEIRDKYMYRYFGSTYGMYVLYFGQWIHTWPLYNGTMQYAGNVATMGTLPQSLGCIRLPIDAAKYVYDTVPIGTKMICY